jgi:hypothetical protein
MSAILLVFSDPGLGQMSSISFKNRLLALTFLVTDVPTFTPESQEVIVLAVNHQVSTSKI